MKEISSSKKMKETSSFFLFFYVPRKRIFNYQESRTEKIYKQHPGFSEFIFKDQFNIENDLIGYIGSKKKSMGYFYVFLYQRSKGYPWDICIKETKDFKRMYYDKKE